MKRITRRSFLFGAAATGAGVSGASYMRYFEPRALEVNTYRVSLGTSLPKPFKVLHLSDFHASDVVPLSYLRAAIEKAVHSKPDLIVLTGDFITKKLQDPSGYAEVLSLLPATAPTFAVAGNHDGGSWAGIAGGYSSLEPLRELLTASSITLLENESRKLSIAGTTLWLVGLGDLWSDDLRPEQAFAGLPSHGAEPVLALAHNPDSKEQLINYPWDLLLSGHTHGGQLVVPFINYRPFLPVADYRYPEGLHPYDGRQIYITRGVGNLHGLRFNCPPEASVLELE